MPTWTPRILMSLALLLAAMRVPAADLKPVADEAPALDKPTPESLEELKVLQERVKKVLDKVIPCTVGIQVGSSQGSGVIINKDGTVLTAGHVSGDADKPITLILPDGKRLKGRTLGANNGVDNGMVKITDDPPEGGWSFAEMGKSADVRKGQWVIGVGHPGGYQKGRPPVVRVGRVLSSRSSLIQTDCTLVGGDSGGPLFDLDGKVVGIHSRIGGSIAYNIHVPVDTFRRDWDKLAKGEVWGGFTDFLGGAGRQAPYIGFEFDPDAPELKVDKVVKDSPAEKAGLREGDVILKFDDSAIKSPDDLAGVLKKHKPKDEVVLTIRRGDKDTVTLKITLGERPS